MPWKETSVMDERMKFIGRPLGGERVNETVNHVFGIIC